ncbi:transposase [Methylovulum miyakonense]|uniref:transposase n=1 Tax=Methylovulum miyakonense TaxID=645578 RepID=UPI0012EB638A|nr:transposase [Methylovulum miyakonense]
MPRALPRPRTSKPPPEKWDDEDKISLFYFDESGFSTASSVPYAWQPKGRTLEIPCFHSQRLNVLGFVSRDSRSFFPTVEGERQN